MTILHMSQIRLTEAARDGPTDCRHTLCTAPPQARSLARLASWPRRDAWIVEKRKEARKLAVEMLHESSVTDCDAVVGNHAHPMPVPHGQRGLHSLLRA